MIIRRAKDEDLQHVAAAHRASIMELCSRHYSVVVVDLHDSHQFRRVVDLIDNAVVALANAVLLCSAELLAALRSWVAREQLDPRDNALTVGLAKIADLLGRRTLDFESIAFHVA